MKKRITGMVIDTIALTKNPLPRLKFTIIKKNKRKEEGKNGIRRGKSKNRI